MKKIKISSRVDKVVWNDLKSRAKEQHQSISDLLTEAIREYLEQKRVRPEVMKYLEASMERNEELGKLLAK